MDEFNKEELQKYYDSRNYAGAANYLQNHLPTTSEGKLAIRERIRQLKKYDAIQKSELRNATPEQAQAYDFVKAIDGEGVIPRDRTYTLNGQQVVEKNEFGTSYNDYMNGLQSNDGNRIDRIAIDIDDDDNFNAIKSELGIDNFNTNKLGLQYQSLGKGKHRIIVPTTNKQLYKVVNAANNIKEGSWQELLSTVGGRALIGSATGGLMGTVFPVLGNVAGTLLGGTGGAIWGAVESAIDYFSDNAGVRVRGVDGNGKVYDEGDYNSGDLRKAVEIIDKARNSYKELQEAKQAEIGDTYTSEVEATQFMGAGHAKAFDALNRNEISLEDYNKIVNNWKDAYNRLVAVHDFSSTPMYAWQAEPGKDPEDQKGKRLETVDPANVGELEAQLKSAMHAGNVEISQAIKDGELGTMFTIIPKSEEGENKWSKEKGKVETYIFVKGLFIGDDETAFEQDTQTMAVRDLQEMKRYGYEIELASGTTVGYGGGYGGYIKTLDENNRPVITQISDNMMLRYLREGANLDKSLDAILSNIDENGNMYNFDSNGNVQQLDIYNVMMTFADAATNDIFSDGVGTPMEKLKYRDNYYKKLRELLAGYIAGAGTN